MYYIFATSNKQRREIKWSRCNMMPRCFRSGISSNMRERSFLPSAVSGWRQRRSSTGSGRLWSVLLRPSGGGTLRDLLLGVTPFWMLSPSYMYCTLLGMGIVFIFSKQLVRLDTPFFIFDAIGLALFVVIGVEKTLELNYPFWVAITMGTITGIAGGVMRDIFINETPLVFRQEVYALACVMGGIVFALCYTMAYSNEVCELSSSATILLIRILAVKYHWRLPKMKH